MNVLNKLTLQSLKLNRKRTIVTIIGIMLSCALICAVTGMVTSFQASILDRAKQTDGNFHVSFTDIPKDKQKYLENNVGIQKIMYSQDVGFAKLEQGKLEDKPYLFVQELDTEYMNNSALVLLEGRMPENENEIVIPKQLKTEEKLKYEVGDTIELALGKRMRGDEELNQGHMIVKEDSEERIVSEINKKYKIVGVIQRPKFQAATAPVFTLISHLDHMQDRSTNANVLYHNVKDTYTLTNQIVTDSNGNADEEITVSYNAEILKWSGVSSNQAITQSLPIIAGIVIAIIIFTSIFVIRNSFSISVTERLRQYGMLSSIGATSKQIRKNVLFEGVILGAIAIPLGIVLGILADYVLFSIVNIILKGNLDGIILRLSIMPIAIVLTMVLSAITIFLSSIIPSIKASKISPIEAIYSSNDIKIKAKKLKTSKIIKKVFGIEGEVALKNLKRSKKKYRATVFSIFCSIVIVISLSSFITFAFSFSGLFYEKGQYNVSVSKRGIEKNEDIMEYFTEISKLDNIEKYSIIKQRQLNINADQYLTDEAKNIIKEESNEGMLENTFIDLIAIGETQYNEYIKELGGKPEDYKDKGILIDSSIMMKDGKRVEYDYLKIKNADIISGEIIREGYQSAEEAKIDVQIEIKAITDKIPFGLTGRSGGYARYIIVSDEKLQTFGYQISNICLLSNAPYQLVEDIKDIDETKVGNIFNLEESIKQDNSLVLVISIFLYGFISVISLIGITNIFNTITTNMALRSKEFAILKSIGMTDKEFKKMINFESLFYGLKALLFGIPVGIALSYAIYMAFKGMFQTAYILPWQSIIISTIFVFVIIFSTMTYSRNKAKRQNIIETIRNENT